jgi:uncharacterized protein DUF4338
MPVTIGGGLSFCGRELTSEQLELIRQITREFAALSLTELALTICELLDWKRPNGGLKSRECYLFLQSLRQRGWLPWLPAPQPRASHPHITQVEPRSDPRESVSGKVHDHAPLQLDKVVSAPDRKLFEQYLHRYHYLGYRVPYGAQLRYLVRSPQAGVLACLLFTSAGWKMADRDQWIGWTEAARKTNLPLLVNNSRFLILPWVRVPNLASHLLALVARRVQHDWWEHYHSRPVLLETLVDEARFRGSCYRAANWKEVGITQGRGRMDTCGQNHGVCKRIFLYPLDRRWRERLCQGSAV